ncbi:hypothetical protein DOY81_007650 [Sarcophaga bullata]|nr:hypothetical protein DOY81_007650 [Sarcophaga bullata]
MKLYQLTLALLLCMWHCKQAAMADSSADEHQIKELQTFNDFLHQKMIKILKDLNKQVKIINDLQEEVNSMPQLIQDIQEYINEINKKVDTKLNIIESNTLSRDILNNIIVNNENNTKNLMDEIQQLLNEINRKIDAKLSIIESNKISRNKLTNEIINNQKNMKNLMENINLERHTQTLTNTISNKLTVISQMDAKLSGIEKNTISKSVQLNFYSEIEKYFKKQETCSAKMNQVTVAVTSTPSPTQSFEQYPTSCTGYNQKYCQNLKCQIINHVYGPQPFTVPCVMPSHKWWTVIQRRFNGGVDFYRSWSDYKAGFGNLDGEFFIGLDKLHALTATLKPVVLLIFMRDVHGTASYVRYSNFQVASERENYKLISVGSFMGNTENRLSLHVGYPFSTKDRDNDQSYENCAVVNNGAWWYNRCFSSDLNARYNYKLRWVLWDLAKVTMLIRPGGYL